MFMLVHLPCCFFFPVLLLSSGNVVIVRIRSTTPVRLLHGLLLPSGISGKMTVTLDLTTIIAMLVASFYHYAALPITCFIKPPKLPCQPLTFYNLPSKPLLGYVTAFAQPLLYRCELQVKLKIAPWWTGLCWDITISLI